MASLLVAPVFPGLSVLLNHSAWFWMKCIIELTQWFAKWPGAWWNAANPRPAAFVWYYVLLLTLCTGWLFRTRHKGPVAALIAALTVLTAADWGIQSRIARIHILSLRGAPAVFVPSFHRSGDLLLDCGDLFSAQLVVGPFLQSQGVNTLKNFCLTDARAENMGGAHLVLTNFCPRNIYGGVARARSTVYRRFVAQLEQFQRHLKELSAGDSVASWTVFHPHAADQFSQADDNAVVLRSVICGQSLALLSSLARGGQDALAKRHPDLRADIVIAGLPTRDEPLSEPLLDLLQPRLIIVADSETPANRRAAPKLRERLARRGIRVTYCRDTGALTLVFRGRQWEIEDVDSNVVSEDRQKEIADPMTSP